ncbi:MAG: hypothetical protein GYA88_00070 [Clostridiales bacterium]|jgi:hypothetical protein|nr:hypothetical protein [Clostridiales bacterium]
MATVEGLTYRGKPLRRHENTVVYGDPSERHIIVMKILETGKINNLEVATKVEVSLEKTDANLSNRSRVERRSEKKSLYSAMNLGAIWLERALAWE